MSAKCKLIVEIDFEDKGIRDTMTILNKMKYLLTELAEENNVEIVSVKDKWKI